MIDLILYALPKLTFLSSAALLALAAIEFVNPEFRFWPPPEDQPDKKKVFMILFRITVYGLIIASVLHIRRGGLQISVPAILLIFCSFAIAFAATAGLGWENAFGAKDGLRTDGIFRYSRNPIYIATWFGLVGWAFLVPVPFVVATLINWALLYLVAVFIEERWLARTYGQDFHDYCRKVRRFA